MNQNTKYKNDLLFSPAKKKAAKETGDLVGNKIADIIAKL